LRPVAKQDIRTGDVLFFRISGKMSHVGLYLGDDQFVHAPSSGKVVTVGSLRSGFYSNALVRAGRPN
jgi:cell wall-associated NlpC family hydrolase